LNIRIRTKFRYHGHEYSSPNELPVEIRAAYQKATVGGAASLNQCLDKIVLNGRELAGDDEASKLYEDIMRVVENNGQVTLPVFAEPFPTRRQIKMILFLLSALGLAAFAIVARTLN
jgi:hypothetical protein